MTDWPKMESMVMVADGYFESEEFKEIYKSLQKEMFDRVQGIPVKIVGLALYDDNSKHCDVLVGETVFRVPIEYVEYLVADIFEKDSKPTSEEIKSVKAVEEKAVTVSFPFANDSRVEGALLFFARNGYKVWVETNYKEAMCMFENRLNVERPKGKE